MSDGVDRAGVRSSGRTKSSTREEVMSKQSERRANGIDLLRTLGGGSYDPARAATAMVRRHGALGTFAVDHVLGNLWSRPQLSRRDRSLIVVTFLTTIGSIEELRSHVGGALHHGVTRTRDRRDRAAGGGLRGLPDGDAGVANRRRSVLRDRPRGASARTRRSESERRSRALGRCDRRAVDLVCRTHVVGPGGCAGGPRRPRSAASASWRSTGDSANCGRATNCRAAIAAW